jgi:uncharacterized membrane protein
MNAMTNMNLQSFETFPEWSERRPGHRKTLIWTLAGTSALVYGLLRRGWAGSLLGLGGAYLIARTLGSNRSVESVCVVNQTINRSPALVYGFWRDCNNWPLLMKGVESARALGPRSIAWTKSDHGQAVEGRTEIVEDIPEKYLRWYSAIGDVKHDVYIDMKPAPGNRGTEVRLMQRRRGPASVIAQIFCSITGQNFEQYARESLRALKQLLEAGEVPTTDGQPRGMRGMKGKGLRLVLRENAAEERQPERAINTPNEQLATS